MKETAKKLVSAFDMRDGFFFSGLAFLGVGLWMVEPWLAFAVVGGLLIFVSLKFDRKG